MIEQPVISQPGEVTKQSGSKRLHKALPLVVSITCLGLLLRLFWGTLPAVLSVLQDVNLLMLALAWLIKVLSIYVLAMRGALVFRIFGIRQSSSRFFLYTLIGLFFSNFLPTMVGGDVVKAGYAAGRTDRVAEAFLSTFVDRGIGMFGTLLLGGVALFFYPRLQTNRLLLWVLGVVLATLVILVAACRVSRLVQWTLSVVERVPLANRLRLPWLMSAMQELLRDPVTLALTLLLTLASLALASLSLWAMALALGFQTSYLTSALLLALITIASLLPSINGIGVREAVFVFVLQGTVREDRALALAVVFYSLVTVSSTLGGVVFLLRKPLGMHLNPVIVSRLKLMA